jgi:hypothetical protein
MLKAVDRYVESCEDEGVQSDRTYAKRLRSLNAPPSRKPMKT